MKQVGKRIIEIRGMRDRDDIAKAAGIDYGTLAKLELGKLPNPTMKTLSGVAQALGVTILDLMQPRSTVEKIAYINRSTARHRPDDERISRIEQAVHDLTPVIEGVESLMRIEALESGTRQLDQLDVDFANLLDVLDERVKSPAGALTFREAIVARRKIDGLGR